MLDPISDMLNRIRNAQMVGHKEVIVSFSKLKLAIARVLESRGFIESVQYVENEDMKKKNLKIVLKYRFLINKKEPAISGITRISKESRRVYVKKNEIRKIKSGYGLAIISTSQGVFSGEEARRKGLGGEYVCEVW